MVARERILGNIARDIDIHLPLFSSLNPGPPHSIRIYLQRRNF
jgi:hypothetical protein